MLINSNPRASSCAVTFSLIWGDPIAQKKMSPSEGVKVLSEPTIGTSHAYLLSIERSLSIKPTTSQSRLSGGISLHHCKTSRPNPPAPMM